MRHNTFPITKSKTPLSSFVEKWLWAVISLILITLVKLIPGWGDAYTFHVYPSIVRILSTYSNLVPFAVGDLFIAGSIAWVIIYPIYSIAYKHRAKKAIFSRVVWYLLLVYVWFYAAWGLNYSQSSIYRRLNMPPAKVSAVAFRDFAYRYADSLNAAYTATTTDKQTAMRQILHGYNHIDSRTMGINYPFTIDPRPKTMVFSRLSSMARVTGSMGPFFSEFTLNADIRPHDYPATCAHEFAHFLGIANEGEANFYSYIVCTSSANRAVRFSGYYHIFFYMLRNVEDLLGEKEYEAFVKHIRPEILSLARSDREYWLSRRSTVIDETQNFFYNLYLKGNRVEGGMKSYSGVIGIIMAWEKRR